MTVAQNDGAALAADFEVEIRRAVPAPLPPHGSVRAEPAVHRLNEVTAVLVVALLVLAPIPVGSNRPAFWMIWSTLVGAIAFLYGAMLLWLKAPPRFGIAAVAPEVTALALLCAFTAVQLLPLTGLLPPSLFWVAPVGAGRLTLSFDPGNSRLVLIQFLTFGLLFFLTAQAAANRRRARRLLIAILVIVALFAAVGLVSLVYFNDTLLGFEKQIYNGFATGTFINRNSFATFLAVGLTIGVALSTQAIFDRQSKPLATLVGHLALILIPLVAIAAALLATGSRMGALSAALGAASAVLLAVLVYRGSIRTGALVLLGLIAIAAAGIAVFGSGLVQRLVLTPGIDESRVEVHRMIWAAIFDRPWLGYGPGSFATVFQTLQRPPLSAEFVWENSHSTYLALWFEFGVVAGSIPLVIVAMLAYRTIRAAADPSSTVLSVATIGTIVVVAVHSLLDFSMEIEANAFLFIVTLALGAAGSIGRHVRRKNG